MSKLLVQRLSESAVLPTRATSGSAGYDLSSAKDVVIPARGKGICPTDLAMTCPEGCYGRIAPRSGLSWKNHIDVGGGTIDQDFTGNVGVILFNHSDTDLKVSAGDRVAQLILVKIEIAEVIEVDQLEQTERGMGGFGSTGLLRLKEQLKKARAESADCNEELKRARTEATDVPVV